MHLDKSKLSITKHQWQHLLMWEKTRQPQTIKGSITEFKSIAEPVLGIEIYGSDPFEVRPAGQKIAAPTFCLLTVFCSFVAVWVFKTQRDNASCVEAKSHPYYNLFFYFSIPT